METINPLTGQRIKSYTEFSEKQIADAINQAHKAFESWRRESLAHRAKKMDKAAQVLTKNKNTYAKLMAEEMGKPLAQGQAEIEKCAWVCEFYAKEAENYLAPEHVKTDGSKSYVRFDPLGIVLAVMPWNFPFWQVFRCAAPTLMAGNAIVLKHAANVSGCALIMESIFKEAEFPEGLFRTLLLSNQKVGQVISHPFVQAVTLTGSTGAGQAIASQAGTALKRTVLELGGSDPYIVLEDADVKKAAETCAASRMINGGQSCVSAKRFIVAEPVLKEFQETFIAKMKTQKMGPPLEEGTTLGPLARHDLRDQIHTQVQESVKKGAQLLLGGTVPDNPGAFYPPTVLGNVLPGMRAYHEELFGPAATILKARDEKEAVHIANDSVFGLGAAIFSEDVKRAERLAVELEVGCCFINEFVRSDPRLPFGGVKQSGYGRELSSFGIREFVNIKTVYVK
jgi:succinate-semialdehyde dehydrogenase/glutarate-semialdehyde dehydrogenase